MMIIRHAPNSKSTVRSLIEAPIIAEAAGAKASLANAARIIDVSEKIMHRVEALIMAESAGAKAARITSRGIRQLGKPPVAIHAPSKIILSKAPVVSKAAGAKSCIAKAAHTSRRTDPDEYVPSEARIVNEGIVAKAAIPEAAHSDRRCWRVGESFVQISSEVVDREGRVAKAVVAKATIPEAAHSSRCRW